MAVGRWLDTYGEAVYSTRAYGENATGNVRYTSKGPATVYAFLVRWDGNPVILTDIDPAAVSSITPLGNAKTDWNADGGKVILTSSSPANDGPATVVKIALKP